MSQSHPASRRTVLALFTALFTAVVATLSACDRSDKQAANGTAGTPPPAAAPAPTPPAPTAAPGAAVPGAPAEPVAAADRAFVDNAASSGLAEVEASRYIAEKTGNADLKDFARRMEREHTSANDELMRIAGAKGLTVPTSVAAEERAMLDKLRNSSSDQSDRIFIQDLGVDAHRKAIQLYEAQVRDGRDPELRAFAERTLPTLREHLAMAEQLQGRKP